MAEAKTTLGLNQWTLDEKPRMEDFNEDNAIIDQAVRSKVDQGEYDAAMAEKVDVETFREGLATKVDNQVYEDGLALKVDKSEYLEGMAGKVDNEIFNQSMAQKVDQTMFDAEMQKKVDVDVFETAIDKKVDADVFDAELQKKVDQVEFESRMALKADQTEVNAVSERTDVLEARVDEITENDTYTVTATYLSGVFVLEGLPNVLPDTMTVRFLAPVDYTVNDALRIGTKNIPIFTPNGRHLNAGVFIAGSLVSFEVDYAGGKAFFSAGGGKGGDGADYGILPSQTTITRVVSISNTAEVQMANVGGEAYAGTKLVCKPGDIMPYDELDGDVYDAGASTAYTIEGLNSGTYTARTFAYNRNDEIQTDINRAVNTFNVTYVIPGNTWKAVAPPTSILDDYYRCTYGNGRFFLSGSSRAGTSTDGVSWSRITLPDNAAVGAVCYGNGVYVVMSTKNTYTSTNGTSWVYGGSLSTLASFSLRYDGRQFIGLTADNKVLTSLDGKSWTARSLPSSNANFQAFCYGGGKYVGITSGLGDNVIMTSTDAINWTVTDVPKGMYCYSVCYGNGKFVANTGRSTMLTSDDGYNWTLSEPFVGPEWLYVCFGGGAFVAVGRNAGTEPVMVSDDGITWTRRTAPISSNGWRCVCYGDGRLVAGGQGTVGERIMTSPA